MKWSVQGGGGGNSIAAVKEPQPRNVIRCLQIDFGLFAQFIWNGHVTPDPVQTRRMELDFKTCRSHREDFSINANELRKPPTADLNKQTGRNGVICEETRRVLKTHPTGRSINELLTVEWWNTARNFGRSQILRRLSTSLTAVSALFWAASRPIISWRAICLALGDKAVRLRWPLGHQSGNIHSPSLT